MRPIVLPRRNRRSPAPAASSVEITFISLVIVGIVLLGVAHFAVTGLHEGLDVAAGQRSLRPFDLDREAGFGTWASTVLLLVAAGGAAALATWSVGRERRRGWAVLGALLAVMSVDEVVGAHEIVGEALQSALDLHGVLYFAWVLPAAALLAVLVVWQWSFLRSLRSPLRGRLLAAGLLYALGVLGLEMLGSWLLEDRGSGLLTAWVAGVEELLELAGITVLISALGRELADGPALRLAVGPAAADRRAAGADVVGPGGGADAASAAGRGERVVVVRLTGRRPAGPGVGTGAEPR